MRLERSNLLNASSMVTLYRYIEYIIFCYPVDIIHYQVMGIYSNMDFIIFHYRLISFRKKECSRQTYAINTSLI